MKLTDVPPVDLTKWMGKAKNRVRTIGVELEGGWSKLPPGVELVRDGSINFGAPPPPSASALTPGYPRHIGELPSGIMKPGELTTWLKQSYPSHVNTTCGLHIHMGVGHGKGPSNLWYQRLVTPVYGATIIAEINKWARKLFAPSHPIFARLKGKSQYCTLDYFPKGQIQAASKSYSHNGPGNRYTWINYCHGLHGTVECRGLPMFEDVNVALEALLLVINVTNAFLASQASAGREPTHVSTEVITDDCYTEELIECV